MTPRALIPVLFTAATLSAQVNITYLANEGVLISTSSTKVLVDALFRDSLGDSDPSSANFEILRARPRPDIALVPFWWLTKRKRTRFPVQYMETRPNHRAAFRSIRLRRPAKSLPRRLVLHQIRRISNVLEREVAIAAGKNEHLIRVHPCSSAAHLPSSAPR